MYAYDNFRNNVDVDALDPSYFEDGDVLKTTLSIKFTNKLGVAMYFHVSHEMVKILSTGDVTIQKRSEVKYLEPNEVWEPYSVNSPSTIETTVAENEPAQYYRTGFIAFASDSADPNEPTAGIHVASEGHVHARNGNQ